MLQTDYILGIDIGSVSISLVCLNASGELKDRQYAFHQGKVRETVDRLLAPYQQSRILGIAAPSGKTALHPRVRISDTQVCILEACEYFSPGIRSVIHVGAERFFMMALDEKGSYSHTRHSSSCAAGTGSFLDQQAVRLGMDHVSSLSDLALSNRDPVPRIAARCSVFAKTDLIHAQQKGFGLGAICDSLCRGLADNIADTLFSHEKPVVPLMMTGGVSRNRAVVRRLEEHLGAPLAVHDQSPHFPALGAALLLLKEIREGRGAQPPLLEEVLREEGDRSYYYDPLQVSQDEEPCEDHADYQGKVRIDVYRPGSMGTRSFYLGIDVGSTSTKAVLAEREGEAFAGFYTYTGGQPLRAVQTLFRAMDHLLEERGIEAKILACGTTGSGRKFIGGIVGADQDVDEITAHARAAYQLNPLTDTIIEIGGQDAKFTRMKDGMVTFSHMNTVCAAGTGSFLEELASRLGVELRDYEQRAMGQPAPLASDRCTVFMERDINQLLSQGYSVDEVLATVIHSVRENYLKKVAGEARIGEQVCFQGATAKNRALVAAFEQKLGRSIFVSPLCHLTGALGTALILKEEHSGESHFRGLDLHSREIPVETEQCELCLNHCTLSVASINGEKLAYGFLCGRDYETKKFVPRKKGAFDLLKERQKCIKQVVDTEPGHPGDGVVGLPASLHMAGDLEFWKVFLQELGIKAISSEKYRGSLPRGKQLAGAEFCAPMVSMYGHASFLQERCDFIFLPVYLESMDSPGNNDQNFCYYTQYSGSLASMIGDVPRGSVISPLLNFSKKTEYNAVRLQEAFREAGMRQSRSRIIRALDVARSVKERIEQEERKLFRENFMAGGEVSVMLLGRPYVLLSESLNKGITGILSSMEVPAFCQEMLEPDGEENEAMDALLAKVPWYIASRILRTAEQLCRTPGLYPVLVTAFKCAPDSFIQEYFKQIMELYGKPYLVIQIDEHDSNVGYETRIEAALRSFRNHKGRESSPVRPLPENVLPVVDTRIGDRILLMPNWDSYVSPLVVANLRRGGYDARLLESSPLSIRKSMAHNTGQCLPINVIAQNYMDYIRKYRLDPEKCILWMMESHLTCNIRQYPFYIKRILEQAGNGVEGAAVYSGKLTHRELSLGLTYNAYFAYMLGGLFRKVACRIRPYEYEDGQTDAVAAEVQQVLMEALSGNGSMEKAVKEGMAMFEAIDYNRKERRPLVAVFGDLYLRDNDVMNQDLVRHIEAAGGEALMTPYHDYTKLSVENIFRRAVDRGERVETGFNRIVLNMMKFMDDRYYRHFTRVLGPAPVIRPKELEKKLSDFKIDLLHSGESYDNLLKIFYIRKNYPKVALFVQTNPSYCCAALVTEAMTPMIRELTGVPVLTLTYDGTRDSMNEAIVPYIRAAAQSSGVSGSN